MNMKLTRQTIDDGRRKIQGNRETNDNSLITLADFMLFRVPTYLRDELVASQRFLNNFVKYRTYKRVEVREKRIETIGGERRLGTKIVEEEE